MSIPGSAAPFLLAQQPEQYRIKRSLRFNSSDSAYLGRTPSVAGNRKTWTWAGWVKRTKLGEPQILFVCFVDGSNYSTIEFYSATDQIRISNYVAGVEKAALLTTQVFRDPSSWYHIVVASNSSSSLKLYVNGSEITQFSVTTGPDASDWFYNSTNAHNIGRYSGGYYLNGYLADVYFIDGQALDPTSFGEFDANGVWQPKAYTGTYGTNGFHLPFSDNSTAAALGTDASGNGNDWTVHNISVNSSIRNYTAETTAWWDQDTNPRPYLNSNAYDGNSGTYAGWPSDSSPPSTTGLTVLTTFNPPIPYSSSVVVSCLTGGPSATKLKLNGVIYAGGSINISGSGLVSTLQWGYDAGASITNYSLVQTVTVDGSILIDNTVITNDSLVDTPTSYGTDTGAGGEVRGNYCTWNPLAGGAVFLQNGNLDIVNVNTGSLSFLGSLYSGGFYAEISVSSLVGSGPAYIGINLESGGDYWYVSDGTKQSPLGSQSYSGVGYTTGDIVGIAYSTLGVLTFYKNGVSQGIAFSGLPGNATVRLASSSFDARSFALNAGQRPFAYTAPSGFKALCTTNLPEPQTITTSGSYTGNGVADGPFVYLNGVPTAMTVNGNAVTFGTEADKLSNGFKVRTTSTTYNQNAVVYNYSITSTGDPFKRARAQSNP